MRRLRRAVPLLHDYLLDAAAKAPNKVALTCGSERVTYAELDARSNALAHYLRDAGVQRGDRVLLYADNSVETVASFWGALKADAVPSVINPLTRADKLRYLLGDCRPAALITEQHLYPVFAPAVRDAAFLRRTIVAGEIDDARLATLPGGVRWLATQAIGQEAPPARRGIDIDLAAIIYTSGSTGDPKGVMLTHRNMLTACASIAALLELTRDDVIASALPLAFNYGLYQMIMAFRSGARLLLERSFAYPAPVLKKMADEGATGFAGVPTMFSMLAEMKALEGATLPKVRYVTNTAAALTAKHIATLRRLLPNAKIYSMYGLTECKRCTWLPPEDLDRKPGSVGIAIPNTEMWIVDEAGSRVGPGVVGELVIRGGTVMKGYWGKPGATAERLRPGPLPDEKVLYTGDLCRIDEDGYLYLVGRLDDVIKSRGEKVAPKEVETALMNIPGVREAAVIGVPDETLGAAVKAFVVLEEGAALTERELKKECQGRLESFMVPKFIAMVPSLPKTDTGKIRKIGLT
jgi:amino acid adenylation domain-containing protein